MQRNISVADAERFLKDFLNFVNPPILFAIFGLMALCFAVASMILVYHWKNYDFNRARIKKVQTVYFTVSGIFFFVMSIAAVLYAL